MVVAVALALAGCASGPKPDAVSAPASSAQSIDAIAEYLNQGDVSAARKLIKSGLKRDPNNPSLALLRDSIARDPVELLGPQSFDYVVQSGDTLVGIAQRFLGNRLLTYQLARYNGIEKPTTLTAGQTLRIPGTEPAPARRAPTPASSTPSVPSTPRAQPPKQAVAPPASRTDPAAARQLRTQGLAALHKGSATRAVQLLRRAAALDPSSAVIKADLARAERIEATVRSRR
jgi:LysM repeat protein